MEEEEEEEEEMKNKNKNKNSCHMRGKGTAWNYTAKSVSKFWKHMNEVNMVYFEVLALYR